ASCSAKTEHTRSPQPMTIKKIKYTASYQGAIVGTRTSHRVYTHAVICQRDQEAARKAAYGYQSNDTDLRNFNYYRGVVDQRENHPNLQGSWNTPEYRAKQIAEAQERIEGGLDGYIARVRQALIDRYEWNVKSGNFNVYAACWAGRRDLAEKAARQRGDRVLAIVEAVPNGTEGR